MRGSPHANLLTSAAVWQASHENSLVNHGELPLVRRSHGRGLDAAAVVGASATPVGGGVFDKHGAIGAGHDLELAVGHTANRAPLLDRLPAAAHVLVLQPGAFQGAFLGIEPVRNRRVIGLIAVAETVGEDLVDDGILSPAGSVEAGGVGVDVPALVGVRECGRKKAGAAVAQAVVSVEGGSVAVGEGKVVVVDGDIGAGIDGGLPPVELAVVAGGRRLFRRRGRVDAPVDRACIAVVEESDVGACVGDGEEDIFAARCTAAALVLVPCAVDGHLELVIAAVERGSHRPNAVAFCVGGPHRGVGRFLVEAAQLIGAAAGERDGVGCSRFSLGVEWASGRQQGENQPQKVRVSRHGTLLGTGGEKIGTDFGNGILNCIEVTII